MMCNNNDLNKIDINIKKYQRYYIRYLFKNKIATDKFSAIEMFKEKFGKNIKFNLTDNDINVEKSLNVPNPNDKTLEDLIKYLQIENQNIIIKKTDIIYDYKYYDRHDKKNYNIKREQEIIFFGTEEMINQLKDLDNEQYFIDVTYKIIPYKYHLYKLLTMKAFNKKTKNTKLCILITIKYEDENSFYYTFKYLKEFLNFKPKIINIDFSNSLYKAIKFKNLFNDNIKIIFCFFHYSQSIIRKMKSLKIIKNKLTKKGFSILLNIQILSFLKPELIKNYAKFLKNNLKESEEINLYKYIDNYWLNSKGISFMNYYDYIQKNNNYNLKYLFFTNNVIESFHSKLSNYLPKGRTTSKGFILSLKNILNDIELKKNEIKRHDYKIQTIIKIAQNYNNSKNNFNWISYEDFYKIEKEVILILNKDEGNEENINKLINELNQHRKR